MTDPEDVPAPRRPQVSVLCTIHPGRAGDEG